MLVFMRNIHIYLLVLLTLLLSGCDLLDFSREGRPAVLSLELADTKASGVLDSEESYIHGLQGFIFRPDGLLDGYASSASGTSLEVSCTTGERSVVVLANCPAFLDVVNISGLAEKVLSLSEVIPMDIPMIFSKDITLRGNMSLPVALDRMVCKASVLKVSNRLIPESLSSQAFVYKEVSVNNAVGGITVSGTPSGLWYNRLKNCLDLPGMLYDDIDMPVPLNGSYDVRHDLYFFPNPVSADEFSSVWSPRHTRTNFVISVGGQEYNYPVTLPVGVRNTVYTFNEVIVTRIGTLDPESPLSFVSIQFADPSVGDMGPVEGGVVEMNPKSCSILFAVDGVDPMDYFGEYIDINPGLPVIFFSNGEVGPFNAVTDRLTVGNINGIIVFKDGTLVPFDQWPDGVELPNVEKVIIFNGSVEEFLKENVSLRIQYSNGIVVISDGSVDAFSETLEDVFLKPGFFPVVFGTSQALEDLETLVPEFLEMISGNIFPITFSSSGIGNWSGEEESVIIR